MRAQVFGFEIAQFVRHYALGEHIGLQNGLWRGREQAVAGARLEIQIGQRRRIIALVLYRQREPQPQLRDVHRELVLVHAVEVAADDAQLAVVLVARVGRVGFVEQRVAQREQLLHHPKQIRAAAAGGIHHARIVQRADTAGFADRGSSAAARSSTKAAIAAALRSGHWRSR